MLSQAAIPLRPGVARLLAESRRERLRLAIATTTTPANVKTLLRHSLAADSEEWFDVIAAGDIVPAKKPAPDIYTWAMAELGLSPDVCMAFEDSENGVRSAYSAGIRSILVTRNEYTRGQDLIGAACVLDHLGEPDLPCHVESCAADLNGLVDVAFLRQFHSAVS
jgi:HAD superfamily hydrolase (TIGR01509 family)